MYAWDCLGTLHLHCNSLWRSARDYTLSGTLSCSVPLLSLTLCRELLHTFLQSLGIFLICPSAADAILWHPSRVCRVRNIFQIRPPWKAPGMCPRYPERCKVCKWELKVTYLGRAVQGKPAAGLLELSAFLISLVFSTSKSFLTSTSVLQRI